MSRFTGGGLVAKFVELCQERIETMNEALLSLIGDPDNVAARGALFQEIEALLGESGMLNLMEFRDLVVEVDAVLRWGNEQNFDVHPQFFEIAFEGVETLRTLANAGIQDVPAAVSTSVVGFGTRARAWLVNPPRPEPPPPPPPPPEPEPLPEPEFVPKLQGRTPQPEVVDPMRAQLVGLFASLASKRVSALRQLVMDLQSLPRAEHIPRALREIESIRSESNILGLTAVSQVAGHVEMLMLWLSARHFQGPGQAFNGITVGLDLLDELIASGLGLDSDAMGDVDEYQLGVSEWIRDNEAEPIPDAPAWASEEPDQSGRDASAPDQGSASISVSTPVPSDTSANVAEAFDEEDLPDEDTEDVMPDWLREPPTMEQDKAALATETHGTVNREDAGVSSAWRPRFFDELAAMQAQQHLETEEVTDPNLSGAAPLPGTPTDVALDVGSEDETQPFAVPEEWPALDASSDEDTKAGAVPEEMGEISDEEESIDDDPTSTPALDFLAEVESLFGKDVSSASSVSDQGVFVDLLPDVQLPTEERTSPSGDSVLEDASETVEPLSSETISEVSDDASQSISVSDMKLDEFPESPTSTESTPVAEDIVTFVAEAVAPQSDVSLTESPSTGFEVSPTQMDELVRLGGAVQVDQSNQGLEVARVAEIAAAMKEDVAVLAHALTDSDDTVPVDQAMDALGKTYSELEQRLSGFAALERETTEGVTAFQNELHHVHGLSAEEWFDRHPDTRFALGHVLLVRSNTMIWGLPVAVVDEIVPASDSIDDGAAKVLAFDGAEIAYAPLDTLVGPSDGVKTASGPIVVLGVDGHRFGIQVDAVLGQKRVVRQAAEPFLGGLTHLGGTAVLDGNTAISVLEARALAHQASVSAHMD